MSNKQNKSLEQCYEEYLGKKEGVLISPANFQVFLRGKGFKRKDYLGNECGPEIKEELNLLYEDGLIKQAAKGERYSQTFTQLLKAHTEKMERESKRVANQIEEENKPIIVFDLEEIDMEQAHNIVVDKESVDYVKTKKPNK